MSKPTTYRGIPYTLIKGDSLTGLVGPTWYGIALIDGHTEVICESHVFTKADALTAVKAAICARLGIEFTPPLPRRRKPYCTPDEVGIRLQNYPAGNEGIERLLREARARDAELEIQRKLSLEIMNAGFRVVSPKYHPDLGGSTVTMTLLTAARDDLRRYLARPAHPPSFKRRKSKATRREVDNFK